MRIRLEQGKQKELILLAKNDNTWKNLSKKLNINENYLANDLKSERKLISDDVYHKLCNLIQKDFNKFIITKLKNNWGQSIGGRNSKGSLLDIKIPGKNEKLAEVIGAILGDGNVNYYKKGKKIGVYQIKIAGDSRLDKDYHMIYLNNLFFELFGLNGKEILSKIGNTRFINFSSKKLVEFFIKEGLKSGDKIENQVTIPEWIWGKNAYLKACLRGLIDTDGSIFKMSNKDPKLMRIGFTNHNKTLLEDTRKTFIILGFHPSKIINNRQFYLSRQEEISKYLKEIGFSNKKHQDRLLRLFSPVV